MAALILPSRRVVQPQGPVEVDWGNPLARAANVWTPQQPLAFQSANNIQTATEVAYSAAPISAAGVGRQWTRTASAGINFGQQQIIRQNAGFTVLVVAAPRSQAALKIAFYQRVGGGAFTQSGLVFNTTDTFDITTPTAGGVLLASYHNVGTGVAATGQIDGQPHCWVAGNSTTSGYIFRDGVNQTLSVNTRTAAVLSAATQFSRIGNVANDTSRTTQVHDDPLYLVVVWDRMLSEPEARAVSANPWQLFRPIQRRIWVGGAAVSLPTLVQPASTTSTGAWTPTGAPTLHQALNEPVPSALEYISTSTASLCEMELANSAFPGTANQALAYRASSTLGSTLTVTLKQGATTIAVRSHPLTSTDTLYTQTLTAPEIATIVAGPVTVELTAS